MGSALTLQHLEQWLPQGGAVLDSYSLIERMHTTPCPWSYPRKSWRTGAGQALGARLSPTTPTWGPHGGSCWQDHPSAPSSEFCGSLVHSQALAAPSTEAGQIPWTGHWVRLRQGSNGERPSRSCLALDRNAT